MNAVLREALGIVLRNEQRLANSRNTGFSDAAIQDRRGNPRVGSKVLFDTGDRAPRKCRMCPKQVHCLSTISHSYNYMFPRAL